MEPKMAQVNGHHVPATCPFSGVSVNVDEHIKHEKPNLRVKVPRQPIRLKNYLSCEEHYDTLAPQIEELTHFVSDFYIENKSIYALK